MPRGKPNLRLQTQAQQKDRMRKKLSKKHGPKKICLVMIVKNESRNVYRLLDSLKTVIDMGSIVDTGSTDNTAELFLKWSKENNIPITVHHEPFKNFAYNRTHSFEMAQRTYENADYALLSDADFVWRTDVGNKFDKSLLVDHKYLIEQFNKTLSYWNIRMLSMKIKMTCLGSTHEFWQESSENGGKYQGEIRTAKIRTLVIDDHEDGGCKSDKFERDERLLRQGLDDPDTPKDLKTRYKFYLGQTLKDMCRHEESIEWYTKRVQDKGWFEEVYYAKFQIGINFEQIGWKKKQVIGLLGKAERTQEENDFLLKWNPDNSGIPELVQQSTKNFTDAASSYMAAYNYRKARAESLYYLTRMYRLLSMNEMAYKTALMGKKIPYPKEDSLFIEMACYDYLFDFEISIVAFYLPEKKDEGRAATSKLMERDDLPEWIRNVLESNSRHYI